MYIYLEFALITIKVSSESPFISPQCFKFHVGKNNLIQYHKKGWKYIDSFSFYSILIFYYPHLRTFLITARREERRGEEEEEKRRGEERGESRGKPRCDRETLVGCPLHMPLTRDQTHNISVCRMSLQLTHTSQGNRQLYFCWDIILHNINPFFIFYTLV